MVLPLRSPPFPLEQNMGFLRESFPLSRLRALLAPRSGLALTAGTIRFTLVGEGKGAGGRRGLAPPLGRRDSVPAVCYELMRRRCVLSGLCFGVVFVVPQISQGTSWFRPNPEAVKKWSEQLADKARPSEERIEL